MPKTYVYRKLIHNIYILTIILLIICSLAYLFTAMLSLQAMIAETPLLAIIFFDFVLYRRLNSTKITLANDEIIFTNVANSRHIRYDEISRIDSKSANYIGGWLKIIPIEGKPIRVTVLLKDIGQFIIELKNRLDEADLNSRYDEDKLFNFYKTSVYADQSWTRAKKFFVILYVGTLVETIALSFYIILFDGSPFLAVLLLAMVIGIVPYLSIEYGIYVKEIKRQERRPDWYLTSPDPILEKKRIRFAMIFFIVCILIIVLFPLLLL